MCAIWGMIPFFPVLLALGVSAAPQVIVTQQGVVPIGGLQQLPPGFGGPGLGPGFGPPGPGNIAALGAFGQPLPPGFGGPGFGPGFGPGGPGGPGTRGRKTRSERTGTTFERSSSITTTDRWRYPDNPWTSRIRSYLSLYSKISPLLRQSSWKWLLNHLFCNL